MIIDVKYSSAKEDDCFESSNEFILSSSTNFNFHR